MLKDRFICVQEIIPGVGTRPEDLTPERRRLLERFARNGRFFFGRIRFLSSDGKDVLGELRSFPGADVEARKKDGERLLALAKDVLAGKRAGPSAWDGPPFLRRGMPPFRDGRRPGFDPRGRRNHGPRIGAQAPDFELKFLDSKEKFKLSDNFGKRPTVLIFHSFT